MIAIIVLAASYITSKWPDFFCSLVGFFSPSRTSGIPQAVEPNLTSNELSFHFVRLYIHFLRRAGHQNIFLIISYFFPSLSLPIHSLGRTQKNIDDVMHSSLLTNIFIALSVFHLVAAGPNPVPVLPGGLLNTKLEVRQVSATPSQADLCLDYERTANMSTVGANGSYRTVVMQKANVGTLTSARMMDAAIAKLPALTADADLNSRCGNWTEIALVEAEKNFTQGIVAQFTTEGLPVGILAGPEVLVIVGVIATLFSIVWVFPA